MVDYIISFIWIVVCDRLQNNSSKVKSWRGASVVRQLGSKARPGRLPALVCIANLNSASSARWITMATALVCHHREPEGQEDLVLGRRRVRRIYDVTRTSLRMIDEIRFMLTACRVSFFCINFFVHFKRMNATVW